MQEAEGPERPRRMRMEEGAYKQGDGEAGEMGPGGGRRAEDKAVRDGTGRTGSAKKDGDEIRKK